MDRVQSDQPVTRQDIATSIDRLKDAVDLHITEIENAGENEHSADWFGRAFGYLVMARDAVIESIKQSSA